MSISEWNKNETTLLRTGLCELERYLPEFIKNPTVKVPVQAKSGAAGGYQRRADRRDQQLADLYAKMKQVTLNCRHENLKNINFSASRKGLYIVHNIQTLLEKMRGFSSFSSTIMMDFVFKKCLQEF